MLAVTGIFRDVEHASRAAERLAALLGRDRVILLCPGDVQKLHQDVPATEDMPPVGGALGGVVGGTLGLGLALVVPGVGAVTALGAAAAAVIGAATGYAGWKLGDAADRETFEGPPIDELYVYEDALKRGRTVLIALVDEEDQEEAARKALSAAGAESVDAARDEWWVGVRDAEAERYTKTGGDFSGDEAAFRNGYQAALRGTKRGGTADGDASREAYQRGYDRGSEALNDREGAR